MILRLLLICCCCFVLARVQGQTNSATTRAVSAVSTNAASTNKAVEKVMAIAPPRHPLPPEEYSEGITQFSFLVYGDTRGRRDGKEIQYEHSLVVDSMLETIKKQAKTDFPVRFVLQSGDAVVDGGDAKQWNKSFLSLINRLTRDGGVPYFLAPGNHDVTAAQEINSTNRAKGLQNYLAAVGQLIPPDGAPRRLEGFPCFAFGYGNSFFLALDSNISSNETQLAWATRQMEGLDRTRYTNIFAFFHHPPFSSGSHGGSNIEGATAGLRKRYMPVFRKHHVNILFTGHEHLFEHFVERYQDKATNKFRMDVFVTGGGGAPLYGYKGEPNLTDYQKAGESEKVAVEHLVKPGLKPSDNPYHYLLVQVDGSRLRVEVIGVDWGTDFRPYTSNRADLDPPAK